MPPFPPFPPSPPANFDRLARLYAPLEWLSFGRALSRRRRCFLTDARVASAHRVLVLGDGDGRFTAALVERYPALEVTAVDASADMLEELARRVRAKTPNAALDLQCADLRTWPVTGRGYDLVVSHFVFDCLTTPDLADLVARIAPTLAPKARWLVSDFAVPQHTLWAPIAKLLLRFLYFAFGLLTGLKVRQLPDYPSALKSVRFELASVETSLGGTLRSELWQR
jgi:ubiquinone/menaquinone biosynthesis C-methylase UbiE